MNRTPPISVTIISMNEAENIGNAIRSVSWADEIVVVDSGSTDSTISIAKSLGASVHQNQWPGYGQQKNFAQNLTRNDWVLNIDADEVVSPELSREIQTKLEEVQNGKRDAQGFSIPRKTYYLGRWIKHGGWYPNYLVRLANKKTSKWTEPSVHEELKVQGKTEKLVEALQHYAFTSIKDQVMTNLNFSKLGSIELQKSGQQASVPKLILKPIGKFFETYILKRGFLDGLPGFIISVNAAHSMFLKYAYLSEDKIKYENTRN